MSTMTSGKGHLALAVFRCHGEDEGTTLCCAEAWISEGATVLNRLSDDPPPGHMLMTRDSELTAVVAPSLN